MIEIDQLAPGRFVHRRQLREVLLTPAVQTSACTFVMGAQWPREHAFYTTDFTRPDSALVAETIRQSTILLAHTMYDVPLTAAFLMPAMSGSTYPAETPWSEDQLVVSSTVTRIARGRDAVTALRNEVVIEGAGHVLARGHGDARIVEQATYERLRAGRTKRPSAPGRRRVSARSSILSWRANREATVTVDEFDPVFFDHPLDHVPGMLLLEAVRQGIREQFPGWDVDLSSFDLSFRRIAEFDLPLVLDVSAGPEGADMEFAVRVRQGQVVCVDGSARAVRRDGVTAGS
ncbi:ScbA/BarX family gamma-butyrolactone biosynthesis protein [Frigoribacterium sp. 2-23]|uniref:ScbA/BarX family gamma-butyrolactone biosynthesis protein n=1 Tax=Frigoribacterium sp. 2-23 TaxID=3415006 RepID=UPI003C6FCE29